MTKRLTNEELAEIRERAEKATEGPWNIENVEHQSYAIMSPEYLYGEMFVVAVKDDANFIANTRTDIPKLLAEVETLKDQGRRQQRKLRQVEGLERYYKGFADRISEDIGEYNAAIRNLDALADSVRYRIGCQQDAEAIADEIVGIILDLERKVGDIT